MRQRFRVTPPPAQRPAGRLAADGFTLIELAITIALVAILSAIAYPSFLDAVAKGRRSEAFRTLSSIQLAQERYRTNNASYASSLSVLFESPQTPPSSPNYTLSIQEATAERYRLRAVATGAQARDTRCATMEILAANGSIQYGASCSTCTPGSTLSDPDRCWSR
jgi:type IV pilus assembly protein PilE